MTAHRSIRDLIRQLGDGNVEFRPAPALVRKGRSKVRARKRKDRLLRQIINLI